jgi:chaperonin GroES
MRRPAYFSKIIESLNPNLNSIHMANVKIKPIGDRVLVEHLEEKEQVRGGIIIPDSAKEKPQEAKVIAIGTGKKDEDGKVLPFEVKVGDRVLISKYGGTEVKIEEKKYTIVREDDILGILS